MLLLLIAIYIIILAMELPALLKNGWRREVLVFSLVFVVGVYLSLAQYFHWPLVNPLQSIIHGSSHLLSL